MQKKYRHTHALGRRRFSKIARQTLSFEVGAITPRARKPISVRERTESGDEIGDLYLSQIRSGIHNSE